MRYAALLGLVILPVCSIPALAQDAVRFLGAFDTAGSRISVTPLDDTRLEFCWTNTSLHSECETYVYALENGKARFASFQAGQFSFDLVNNVLTHNRPDGVVKTADMTPVAR